MQKELRAKFDKEQIELRSLLLYFIFILLCMLRERCAGGALVKLTDADWLNGSSPGTAALPNPDVNPFFIERLELLVSLRLRMTKALPADLVIYKNAGQKYDSGRTLNEGAKALFDTCNGQGGFKTFAKTPACLQHTDAYDMIPKAHLFHYYSHPFSLMFEVLVELYKRRQKGCSVAPPTLHVHAALAALTPS